MAINKIKVKLDKKDHFRALLSDTIPFDNPIIFSNDGFYVNVRKIENSISKVKFSPIESLYQKIINPLLDESGSNIESKRKKQSSPYKYKIIKDSYSSRELSLIHPRSQLNYCEFYKKFSPVIFYNISRSKFSIRKPVKVSSSFYIKSDEISGKYKKSEINSSQNELFQKYSSSFFSYEGYTRLYKFFNSLNFYEQEKNFAFMWTLDVSHCFDSIYTHSISWAIKDKDYIRAHLEYPSQFAQELDTLMQRSNNNETNGIPIGSEFSRVFSELIFQRIDQDIEEHLNDKYHWKQPHDYKILRYVDDFIVFSHSAEQALKITQIISMKLKNYNLNLNNQKVTKLERPFCTKKTSMITKINESLDLLKKTITSEKHGIITILKINKRNELYKAFINKCKSICLDHDSSYGDVASYLISSLCSLTSKIIDQFDFKESDESLLDIQLVYNLKDSLFLLSDLIVFFYSVHPNIASSYKTAKSIIIIDEYLGRLNYDYQNIFRTKISHSAENIYIPQGSFKLNSNDRTPIEKMNFILSTTFFGDNYLIGKDAFNEIVDGKDLDYFTIISCLFYFRHRNSFKNLKMKLEKIIKSKLTKNQNFLQDSQQAHLLLDILSCPFVTEKTRREIYVSFLKSNYENLIRPHSEITSDLHELLKTNWFVNWRSHDLLTMIERKELKVTY
ncbi:antiviral reverse transcriptase Drt3b [Siccibacter turicensis]|uniref:antiviral reverse transcriptase Drt3b n=1 Tax=Siccibacter turicensis TaxID=357233 RepID=UPI0004633531|nr:antiviral reverse transcriptase Drt3b [Siccibacter turicensis]